MKIVKDGPDAVQIADAFDAAILEASDADLLGSGMGDEAASVIARAMRDRNYAANGERVVAPRPRTRRTSVSMVAPRRGSHDLIYAQARFSSASEDDDLDDRHHDGDEELN